MAKSEQTPELHEPTRLQRILTGMIVGVIGAAIASIIVSIASAAFGWTILLFVFPVVALVGMGLGMLLMFTLMIVSIRAKIRANAASE